MKKTDVESKSPISPVSLKGIWILVMGAILLSIALLILQIKSLSSLKKSNRVGDGKNIQTYGFDFSHCLVPVQNIIAAGMPKDAVPALDNPPVMSPVEVTALNENERGKYLVPSDRVIGVQIDGEARAYPLRVLNWHEVVNDTLGHTPIAVTYSPLCDSVVVYKRMKDNRKIRLGVSGLVYNSNPLLFDRNSDPAQESLWPQLTGKAISGPRVGQKLSVISCDLVSWDVWVKEHPATTVLRPDPKRKKWYRKLYGNYFGSDQLHFPVHPLPAEDRPRKTPMILVGAGNTTCAFFYDDIRKHIDAHQQWDTTIEGIPVRFRYYSNPSCVTARALDTRSPIQTRYAFYFAWYALESRE